MGVISTDSIGIGVSFGPIPSKLTIAEPLVLIGHMTADNTPVLHTVKLGIHRLASVSSLVEWIPYVRGARDDSEQNLEAVIIDSCLYYRSVRPIIGGSELRVWYNSELAKSVGVPDIHPAFVCGDQSYTCPYCSQQMRYPNSLRAHMRFKCEQNPYLPKSPVLSKTSAHLTTSSILSPTHAHLPRSPVLPTTPPHLQLSPTMTAPTASDGFMENNISPRNSTSGSSGSEQTPPSSPLSERKAVKRKPEDASAHSALNLVKREVNDNHMTQGDVQCFRLPSSNPAFLTSLTTDEKFSAFHKVSKSMPATNNNDVTRPFVHPLQLSSATSHYRFAAPTSLMQPLLGAPPSIANIQRSTPGGGAVNENLTDAIATSTGVLPLKNREDLRNLINCGKLPFHPNWRFHYPYIKSHNPIVENLLTSAATMTPPAPLTQNWCAKCNATFRMTSDLVYHMRSHHKEETHKTKVKPVEKLRCDVCGDRFKERHHLTRHMTSHQEV